MSSTTTNSGADWFVKVLRRSDISASHKATVLKQFGHVFKFAQMPDPTNSKEWEEFRDAEVLESLLLVGSELDPNDVSSVALLDVLLMHLRSVFVNPEGTKVILSNARMKAALLEHMPKVIATVGNALQTEEGRSISIINSAFKIIGALFMSSLKKDDDTFLHSLDKDTVLSILFEAYLAPEPTPDAVPMFHTILSSYFNDGNLKTNAIEKALARHSTKEVTQRCLQQFKCEDLGVDTPLFVYFMLSANNVPELHRLLVEAGVHKSMIERYWGWISSKRKGEEEMCLFARAMAAATASLLRSIEGEDYMGLKTRTISEIVRETDLEFILLLGRTLLGRKSFESAAEDVLYIAQCIKDAIANDKDFINGSLKLTWVHCFKCLDDFKYSAPHKDEHKGKYPYEQDKEQPDFTPAIQRWTEVGELFGFDRKEILAEEAERRKQEMRGLEGCSWFKCCLYRDTKVAPLREMMRCSVCRSAQYCGTRCQKLDWKEGGHKETCSKSKAMAVG